MSQSIKRMLQMLVSVVAMVHIRMACQKKISVDLCLVGVAMQVSYLLLLMNYPAIHITWGLAGPRIGVRLKIYILFNTFG